jgi:phosphoribosylamine---glycine ligase
MSPTERPRRVLVVGSGGREHAIVWRLHRDADAPELLAAPGNDGMAPLARCLPIPESDTAALVAGCRQERVDLVVIGPEAPLAAGLADALREADVPVFGPSRAAARLEASKAFAKDVLRSAGVATAPAADFTAIDDALQALDRFGPPWVIKADGLAGGKGVRVTESRDEAVAFLQDCLGRDRFGAAGARVVMERHLAGEELSVMAVTDGERCVLLPPARDHKRAFDFDRGPNTGGMGAYAPVAEPAGIERHVAERVVMPTLAEMARRGTPFQGVLYAGLMVVDGVPQVLEFNVRFGDPEAEVALPLVGGDFTALLAGVARGALDPHLIHRPAGAAVAVALVDEGYPDAVRGGGRIEGLDRLTGPDTLVFHAGTTRAADGAWALRGGRAACVVGRGDDVTHARERAYAAVASLGGSGWRTRCDIAASGSPVAGGRS